MADEKEKKPVTPKKDDEWIEVETPGKNVSPYDPVGIARAELWDGIKIKVKKPKTSSPYDAGRKRIQITVTVSPRKRR